MNVGDTIDLNRIDPRRAGTGVVTVVRPSQIDGFVRVIVRTPSGFSHAEVRA